jgi:hypothetical protein
MRRIAALLCALMLAPLAQADGIIAYGKADANTPGWAISTDLLPGWTQDCCKYAAAIGVNLVLYQGDWTGKPDRVIVLNVWPAKLPTLDAELQDDRKHYLQTDATGKVTAFPVVDPKAIECRGVLYQGTDHVDDAVVFCSPGKASGIRYSWSMTIGATDPQRQAMLDAFKQVVAHSSYMKYVAGPGSTGKAAAH